MEWRAADREEINQFYFNEFPELEASIPPFLRSISPKEYGIEIDPAHPVNDENATDRSFIRRSTYTEDSDGDQDKQLISQFEQDGSDAVSITEFLQNPAKNDPIDSEDFKLADPAIVSGPNPVAKSVYFSLASWDRYRITAVDIDAKDIAVERADVEEVEPKEGETRRQSKLRKSGVLQEDPIGYPYTFEDIDHAISMAFEIAETFHESYNVEETQVIYSGQGAHVYIIDDDPFHHYDEPARRVIATDLQENHGYTIDDKVTIQDNRLLRLPYTLHSKVSRIVTPIESSSFDPRSQAQPQFLEEA